MTAASLLWALASSIGLVALGMAMERWRTGRTVTHVDDPTVLRLQDRVATLEAVVAEQMYEPGGWPDLGTH